MEMEYIQIIALLATGVAVGFASGLLGVGGCFIMVPVQFWVLKTIGVDPTLAIRIAFGTNLLVVLPTAISGARTHNKKGAVIWKAAIAFGISGLIGAFAGGFIASLLPGKILTTGFGIVVILGAIRMLTAKPPQITDEPSDNTLAFIFWGIPLGVVSGIVGIGGGVIMIPIMLYALKFKMHQAVGTSTALMIFTAIGGIFSYIINGWGVPGLPPYSTGYVNWLQWILLAGCSVPMAMVGAKTAHLLPAKQLKYIFIAVMLYIGLKMAGVFTMLHLPL